MPDAARMPAETLQDRAGQIRTERGRVGPPRSPSTCLGPTAPVVTAGTYFGLDDGDGARSVATRSAVSRTVR